MADAQRPPEIVAEEASNGAAEARRAEELLRVYQRQKQEVAALLREALGLLKQLGDEERLRRLQDLVVKLAEDRFNLVVLGQFKRGKSSLMNALLGRDLLPTGLLPVTSVVTMLRYGPEEKLTVSHDGGRWSEAAPVSDLARFVTEQGNPGNEKGVDAAYVEVPEALLRRGLHFVDTPGVGSLSEQNTVTTYGFLPQVDAALFVTSVDTPLTETETAFLREIRQHARKVFFIVNKIDLLAEDQRAQVLDFIREGLRRETGQREVRLFAMSAREALAAREQREEGGRTRSGLRAVEDALAEFLATERSQLLLVSVLDRMLRLLDEAQAEVELRARIATVSKETRAQRAAALGRRLEGLDREREEVLQGLRTELSEWVARVLGAEVDAQLTRVEKEVLDEREDFLSDRRWASARSTIRDFVIRAEARMQECLDAWVPSAGPALRAGLEGALSRVRPRLEAGVRGAVHAALELYEVPAARTGEEEGSGLNTPAYAVTPPEWPLALVEVPLAFALVPTAFARGAVRRRSTNSLREVKGFLLSAALEAVSRVAEQFVTDIGRASARRASEVRLRITGLAGGAKSQDRAHLDEQAAADLAAKLRDLRSGVEVFRDGLLSADPEVVRQPPAGEEPDPAAAAFRFRLKDASLVGDLETRGCPICKRIARAAMNFFASWQHALTHDGEVNRAFVSTRGFCALHTWQLATLASPRGLDVGYPPLLQRLAAELEAAGALSSEDAAAKLAALLPGPADCLACRVLHKVESDAVGLLVSYLKGPYGRNSYTRVQGVCLGHLHLLLSADLGEDLVRFLLGEHARRFASMAEDMQSYALKFDAVRRGLMNRDEEDAHVRALVHLVGSQSVVAPWSEGR